MTPFPYLIGATLLMTFLMWIMWGIYRKTDNAGIVDVGWGLGLAMLAVYYAMAIPGYVPRKLLITLMVLIWGMRLTFHILERWLREPHEDPRYTALRKKWKTDLPMKFFFFFQSQAILDVILSIPFLAMYLNPAPKLHILEYAGLWIWMLALAGEALSDHQLRRFKSDPHNKGKVCQDGLWSFSRHPNYFCEWLIWVAYATAASASPYGWLGWVGVGLMFYFLNYVTGVPLAEAQSLQSRGDAYRAYQSTTSAFFPRLPKKR